MFELLCVCFTDGGSVVIRVTDWLSISLHLLLCHRTQRDFVQHPYTHALSNGLLPAIIFKQYVNMFWAPDWSVLITHQSERQIMTGDVRVCAYMSVCSARSWWYQVRSPHMEIQTWHAGCLWHQQKDRYLNRSYTPLESGCSLICVWTCVICLCWSEIHFEIVLHWCWL